MSTFSDVLTEYINTKNIKIFPMAKYCGWIVLPCTS